MGAKATGFADLESDFQKALDEALDGAEKVVGAGCNNIKKTARRIVKERSVRGYLPHYPYAIGYTVKSEGTVASGEVGPESSMPQGGLGRIIENGSVNNAPIPHLAPALDEEEPAFAHYIEELGVRLLEGQQPADGPIVDPGGA